MKKSENQCGSKRIARADGIDDLHRMRWAIGPSPVLIKQAAVRPRVNATTRSLNCCARRSICLCGADIPVRVFVEHRVGKAKHRREHRQFVVVQLQHICQLQRFFDHSRANRNCWRRLMSNTLQRVCRASPRPVAGWSLREGSQRCARLPKQIASAALAAASASGVDGNIIPGDIFLNREMGEPVAGEFDLGASRSACVSIDLHGRVRQAHIVKAANDFAPIVILPDTRDHVGLRPECVRVIGEVRRRSAQLGAGEKQVPQALRRCRRY